MLDKKFFLDFIKTNSHKFVFYSYPGGGGGEFVCNYLANETDYFYNKQFSQEFPGLDVDEYDSYSITLAYRKKGKSYC